MQGGVLADDAPKSDLASRGLDYLQESAEALQDAASKFQLGASKAPLAIDPVNVVVEKGPGYFLASAASVGLEELSIDRLAEGTPLGLVSLGPAATFGVPAGSYAVLLVPAVAGVSAATLSPQTSWSAYLLDRAGRTQGPFPAALTVAANPGPFDFPDVGLLEDGGAHLLVFHALAFTATVSLPEAARDGSGKGSDDSARDGKDDRAEDSGPLEGLGEMRAALAEAASEAGVPIDLDEMLVALGNGAVIVTAPVRDLGALTYDQVASGANVAFGYYAIPAAGLAEGFYTLLLADAVCVNEIGCGGVPVPFSGSFLAADGSVATQVSATVFTNATTQPLPHLGFGFDGPAALVSIDGTGFTGTLGIGQPLINIMPSRYCPPTPIVFCFDTGGGTSADPTVCCYPEFNVPGKCYNMICAGTPPPAEPPDPYTGGYDLAIELADDLTYNGGPGTSSKSILHQLFASAMKAETKTVSGTFAFTLASGTTGSIVLGTSVDTGTFSLDPASHAGALVTIAVGADSSVTFSDGTAPIDLGGSSLILRAPITLTRGSCRTALGNRDRAELDVQFTTARANLALSLPAFSAIASEASHNGIEPGDVSGALSRAIGDGIASSLGAVGLLDQGGSSSSCFTWTDAGGLPDELQAPASGLTSEGFADMAVVTLPASAGHPPVLAILGTILQSHFSSDYAAEKTLTATTPPHQMSLTISDSTSLPASDATETAYHDLAFCPGLAAGPGKLDFGSATQEATAMESEIQGATPPDCGVSQIDLGGGIQLTGMITAMDSADGQIQFSGRGSLPRGGGLDCLDRLGFSFSGAADLSFTQCEDAADAPCSKDSDCCSGSCEPDYGVCEITTRFSLAPSVDKDSTGAVTDISACALTTPLTLVGSVVSAAGSIGIAVGIGFLSFSPIPLLSIGCGVFPDVRTAPVVYSVSSAGGTDTGLTIEYNIDSVGLAQLAFIAKSRPSLEADYCRAPGVTPVPSCAGLPDGQYCGGNSVGGDSDTLYYCREVPGGLIEGVLVGSTPCNAGSSPTYCQIRPKLPGGNGNDQCAPSAPDPACNDSSGNVLDDGYYCGSTKLTPAGDPNFVYQCASGAISGRVYCASACIRDSVPNSDSAWRPDCSAWGLP